MMKIVGIGGGTGLPTLLRGLKQLREMGADAGSDDCIGATAIVCVSDDGGSSGLLRQAFGIPAVGDLRNCLVALASGNPTLRDLFQYRLSGDGGLDGHSLGNLIVAALNARAGNLRQAVRLASDLLGLQGDVIPCTEISACLCAQFQDGEIVRGETSIARQRKAISHVWLDPKDTLAAPGVIENILSADAIVLGPGSLFTSIVPNLLPAGVADAIRGSGALKIMVCNLMTQPGETEFFSASDHIRALHDYLGPQCLQVCLLNSGNVARRLTEQYEAGGSLPVVWDHASISEQNVVPIALNLVAESDHEIRHDSLQLARWVVALTRAYQRSRELSASSLDYLARTAVPMPEAVAMEALR